MPAAWPMAMHWAIERTAARASCVAEKAAAGDEDVGRVANEERPVRDPDHLAVGEVVPGGVGAVVKVLDRGAAEADLVLGLACWLEIGIDAVVHRWGGYDVEVDTSVLTPEAAAAAVRAALDHGLPAARRRAAGS